MKRGLIWIAMFALGFATKVAVVEVDRWTAALYVTECFDQRKPTTREGETECYGAPPRHTTYRIISTINAQPSLWKNTVGRCVGTKGTKADAYFQCGWWNRFAI